MIKKLMIITLLFLYIFPLKLNLFGFPLHISIVLLIILITLYLQKIINLKILTSYYLIIFIVMIIFNLIITINQGFDYYYNIYFISQIIYITTGYFIIKYFYKEYEDLFLERIVSFIFYILLIDFIFMIIFTIEPIYRDLFSSIFYIKSDSQTIIEAISVTRIFGLGGMFFGGAVIAGYILLLITYLFLITRKFIYLFYFVIVFIYGYFMAKTIIVAFILSIILITVDSINIKKFKIKKSFFIIAIFFISIIISIYIYIYTYVDINEYYYLRWAFEFFITGELKSINGLNKLFYNVLLADEDVILIGNGIWNYTLKSTSIYMTDIGYFKVLYYTGVVGLILFLIYNMYIHIKLYNFSSSKLDKLFISLLLIYFLVLNLKGFVNLNGIFYLIFFVFYFKKELHDSKYSSPNL